MGLYRYQALGTDGATTSGSIAAASRSAALRQLSQLGVVPIAVEEESEHSSGKKADGVLRLGAKAPNALLLRLGLARLRPTLSRTELGSLIRELATALEAGLPLMQALRTIRRQAHGKSMPHILDHLIEQVETGKTLHQAAKQYGDPFDDMVLGMFKAADATGRMSEVLHQLADLLDRSVELRREVIGATVYPAIVFMLIICSVTILVTVVVPKLVKALPSGPGQELPAPTQILMWIASVVGGYWWALLAATMAGWVGLRAWLAVPRNRMLVDLMLLRAPLIGPLLRDVAVARFTRTLGTLVSAGIPILPALRVVRDTLGNRALIAAIDQVQEKVTTGSSLADPLERSGFFPPLLVQIVNIGEKTGRLESMLLHAANAFDRQVNSSIKVFTKALPPVLLIFMAIIAAFVLAGMLLPLLEMQSRIGG
ncbi:MAG: type II secretion system F family protein [Phycisphaerales bacterium]|nr:type II secretion system F family protein [Phycisphaerales bacterium]